MRLTAKCLKKPPFYVTTPIFYANAKPHIGHLYTALLADAQVRFQSLRGAPAVLSTGTDEHGLKIQRAAERLKVTPQRFVDDLSLDYRRLFERFGVNHSDFVRTTEPRHRATVRAFWNRITHAGLIEKAAHKGWYCVADETFLTDAQIDPDSSTSLESGHSVEWTEEENYVFKIGPFKESIKKWLVEENVVYPSIFANSLMNVLESGNELNVLSVSRPRKRLNWGIPVPGDESQVIYVWLDALANYSTTGFWPADVHLIGKDILKFHAIYWPAFLMAAERPLPKKIVVHSHWMVDNRKMSKSTGNVIDPAAVAGEIGSEEGLRFFLLREGVLHSDGNFSRVKLTRILNAELANTLGNLLNRVTSKAVNPDQSFPAFKSHLLNKYSNEEVRDLCGSLEVLRRKVEGHYAEWEYYKGVDLVMDCLRKTNNYLTVEEPWELRKRPDEAERLDFVLGAAMESLRICGILLQPIIPNLAKQLLDKLSVNDRMWKHASFPSHIKDDVQLQSTKLALFHKIKS